ncbi:MAG: repeat protein [Acidobacteriales bacterium]|nr:repeat protein [Terriglobales bacterium]
MLTIRSLTLRTLTLTCFLCCATSSLPAQTKSKPSKIEPEARSNPAQALLASGHLDEAFTLLQKQIAASPNDAAAFNYLARAHYAEDNTDPAIKAGEHSVELAPNNSLFHLWLGRIYGQKAEKVNAFRAAGFAGKCRDQFERAVQLDPNNLDARADLAEFYTEAPGIMGGGKDKARAQAEAVASTAPAVAHLIRAKIAEKDKDFAQAEKEYKAAIDASGGKAEQWLSLANFYQGQHRKEDMLSAVNKAAIAPQPKSAAVLFDAASLLFQANQNIALAAKLDNEYLTAKDKSEEAPAFKAHFLMGQILQRQGDSSGAVKQYEAALALARDFAPARDALSSKLQK